MDEKDGLLLLDNLDIDFLNSTVDRNRWRSDAQQMVVISHLLVPLRLIHILRAEHEVLQAIEFNCCHFAILSLEGLILVDEGTALEVGVVFIHVNQELVHPLLAVFCALKKVVFALSNLVFNAFLKFLL